MTGVYLSSTTLSRLSPKCLAEIMAAVSKDFHSVSAKSGQAATPAEDTTYQGTAAPFSEREMRKFLKGVGTKTRNFLEGLADMPHRFNVGALLKKLRMQYGDIRGILAGLTKRTRTISGDGDAEFFSSVVQDDDVNKCVSEVHPITHASLRLLLKKGPRKTA